MPLICCAEVSFGYRRRERPVLRAFSIDVERGERLAIVGPSGCGKSTVLSLLAGRLRPWHGTVTGSASRVLVDQGARAFLRRTAVDNTALGAHPLVGWSSARTAARDLLAELGLRDVFERSFWTLSGGERQRVCAARALLSDVDVVLLDEPTAQLDAVAARQVVQVACERIAYPRGLVVATHDIALLPYFDRVIELSGGQHATRMRCP